MIGTLYFGKTTRISFRRRSIPAMVRAEVQMASPPASSHGFPENAFSAPDNSLEDNLSALVPTHR